MSLDDLQIAFQTATKTTSGLGDILDALHRSWTDKCPAQTQDRTRVSN